MKEVPYELEGQGGNKRKHICPQCGKQQVFTRYVCTATGNYLADHVGKCDRLEKCGYHMPPREFFRETGVKGPKPIILDTKVVAPTQLPVCYVPMEMVKRTMNTNLESNFACSLIRIYGQEMVVMAFMAYMVGRSKEDNGGAVIFWQVDIEGKVRTGKIMFYDPLTGKRLKENWSTPKWVHKSKFLPQPFTYRQCFFGEHLLSLYPNKIVTIVESEKTAIHAAIFMPKYNWIATGGVNGVKWNELDVIQVLKGKTVVLFPDFGYYNKKENITCYNKWCQVAREIRTKVNCVIKVSRVLEDELHEEQRVLGLDIADLLINRNTIM